MKKNIMTLLLLACLFIVARAPANLFSQFFFFGDSLSDSGNNLALAPVTDNSGPVWPQFFVSRLGGGTDAEPLLKGGNNYAFAGADTSTSTYNDIFGLNGSLTQISQYLSQHQNRADSHALYSYWAGANDIFQGEGQYLPDSLTNVNTALLALHNAGARYILLMNLPNIGNTPFGFSLGADGGLYSTASLSFNRQLLQQTNALGFDVIQVDIERIFDEIIANPTRFGFTDITTELLDCDDTESDCTPAHFLFYNSVHPTIAAHRIMADYVYGMLTGPLYGAELSQVALRQNVMVNDTITQQLLPLHGNQHLPLGKPNAFFSLAQVASRGGSTLDNLPYTQSHSNEFSVGIDEQWNNNLLLGLHFSHVHQPVNFGDNTGGFVNNAHLISFFSSYQYQPFFIDSIATLGFNHNQFSRSIPLGLAVDTTQAETDALQFGLDLKTGYLFETGALTHGPLLHANYDYVHVNAFSESGALASDLNFDPQNRPLLQTGVGWQANYTQSWQNIRGNIFATTVLDKQWAIGGTTMGAGLVSLPGSHYSIPLPSQNSWLWQTTIGITGQFKNGTSLTLGLNQWFASANVRVQSVNASIGWTL